MKKIWIILALLLIVPVVFGLNEPTAPTGGEDVEKIQDAVDTYVPIGDDGNVDLNKYKPFKTRTEERIEKINLWLEDNATWTKVVFGMVPSLTILFFINAYLWLLFFLILVLNANGLFGFFDTLSKKVNLIFFEAQWSNVLGFIIFVVLLITKTIFNLALVVRNLFDVFWNYILPMGTAMIAIGIVLAIVVVVLLIMFAPQVLIKLARVFEESRKKRAAEKEELNRKALGIMVGEATGTKS